MPRTPGQGPDDPRALNLAKIVFKLIFEPRGILVRTLMDELGIKERTFRAYRQTLESMQQFQDEDGESLLTVQGRGDERRLCLRDSRDGALDASHFAVRFAALNYAKQTFGFLSDTPLGSDISGFCQDYMARVSDQTYVYNNLFREGNRKFYYLPWAPKDYRGRHDDVKTIIRALADNYRLQITYESRRDGTPRTVLPLTLVMWKSSLYLIVQAEDRRRIYMMAVDRMRGVTMIRKPFRYPDPGAYDPGRYLDGGFGVFVEQDRKPKEFELVFQANPDLQRQIRERRWHSSQHFEQLPDNRLRMTFTVTTDVEVWPWIRSFGDAVQVVRPES